MTNQFAFDEAKAAEQFNYRALLLNWVFEPGWNYAQLAKRGEAAWDRYAEAPPEDAREPWGRWRADAARALEFLRSSEVGSKPVRLICETQLLLKPYLEGRKTICSKPRRVSHPGNIHPNQCAHSSARKLILRQHFWVRTQARRCTCCTRWRGPRPRRASTTSSGRRRRRRERGVESCLCPRAAARRTRRGRPVCSKTVALSDNSNNMENFSDF